ncbi:MAG: fibrobacter succinogenes major paralogous domain-containing protein [Candidatus Fibromonas sp.]|nr:fibrobacter succinogenes major paralogous domain-containing protein [Candidatus Fibromonas sp.]
MKKAKMLSLTAGLVLAITFTFSCSSDEGSGNKPPEIIYGPTVGHGGEIYQTVVIGTQTWFARNLNYEVSGSKCYDNEPSNCAIYGRLYDWESAKAACPNGWRLPNYVEREALTSYVGNSGNAGKKLKARNGWNNGGNGTDDYGFSALPGGRGFSDGSFYRVGNEGNWWTANEVTHSLEPIYVGNVHYYGMFYNSNRIDNSNISRYLLVSVRCIKD